MLRGTWEVNDRLAASYGLVVIVYTEAIICKYRQLYLVISTIAYYYSTYTVAFFNKRKKNYIATSRISTGKLVSWNLTHVCTVEYDEVSYSAWMVDRAIARTKYFQVQHPTYGGLLPWLVGYHLCCLW